MSTVGSILSVRIFSALRAATVAAQAGVASVTWSSTSVPRVFRGNDGATGGRNRGRLPYVEFDIVSLPYASEHAQGGTVTAVVAIKAHAGGRDLETIGNLLEGILSAGLASIRSESTDNYCAFGSDEIGPLEPGPWGSMRTAKMDIEFTFDRTDYETA